MQFDYKTGYSSIILTSLVLAPLNQVWAKAGDEAFKITIALIVVPMMLYPIGLALHFCLAAMSPRRSASLATDLSDSRWKTLFLGLCNGLALFILMAVCGDKAPGLSALFFTFACILLLLGSHGISRSLGEWVIENCGLSNTKISPIKALAIGWFIVVYISIIPFIGWFIGSYWLIRGLGGVILQIVGEANQADSITLED